MGKFSLTNLIMCVSKYQKLNSEDYIRLGLCLPDCQDCSSSGPANCGKNDKMVKNNLLLNNQMEDKLGSHHHSQHHQHQKTAAPLKKIVNNLANTKTAVMDDNNNNSLSCNPCKESQSRHSKLSSSCSSSHCSTTKKAGVVNLAFVEPQLELNEAATWYQPGLARDLAVRLLAEAPVGSFVVRNSRSQGDTGHLALSVRVPRTYNSAGILHYLIMVTEAGFRIKGFSKVFSSLSGLVVHHSVMMESLPCRLLISSPTQHSDGEEEEEEEDFADLEADPEYPVLLSRLREQLSSD